MFMQPFDCTIYAVCIDGEEVRYEAKSEIIPILGGAWAITDEKRDALRQKGYVFDNEGGYMSALNERWGELTCVQWMLLNAEEKNIGNAQYRRNWIEPHDEWYADDTLYVPEPAVFACSLEQQFYGGHRDFDAPAITRELADSGQWVFSRKEIDAVWHQNLFIGCNMARGPKREYKEFMTVLFHALIPIWEKHKDRFLSIEGYDKRAIAFIAERIITGLVLHRDRILPNVKIATAPIGFIN